MFGKFIGKIFFATLTAVIFCSLNFCEAAKKTIAIMPLENVSGYSDKRIAEVMTEQLLVAIHSSGGYTVLDTPEIREEFRAHVFCKRVPRFMRDDGTEYNGEGCWAHLIRRDVALKLKFR